MTHYKPKQKHKTFTWYLNNTFESKAFNCSTWHIDIRLKFNNSSNL